MALLEQMVQTAVNHALQHVVEQVLQTQSEKQKKENISLYAEDIHSLVSGYYNGICAKVLCPIFAVVLAGLALIGFFVDNMGASLQLFFAAMAICCIWWAVHSVRSMYVITYWSKGILIKDRKGKELTFVSRVEFGRENYRRNRLKLVSHGKTYTLLRDFHDNARDMDQMLHFFELI
ncbi:MAG: hypothetical protein Q4D42_10950 [Eubacteriales bacterium]|nr:hypothetical protein [Eubacteriales bacterium]